MTEPDPGIRLFQPRRFAIPMPDGTRDIAFTWPERLTEAQWAHLLAVLDAMKPGLTKQEASD